MKDKNSVLKPIYEQKKLLRENLPKNLPGWPWLAYLLLFMVVMIMVTSCAFGAEISTGTQMNTIIEGYSLNQWANAIHKAEGNDNYGILSVKCAKGTECRQICKNTVRNNYVRWKRAGKTISYLRFLANRYCPVGASNDPAGLNRNWTRNVAYWLKKGGK